MRIAGGIHRSRKLHSPPETAETRPIPARVKQSLFNILRGHTENAVVVDLFAGTGAIGLEAISHGAARAVFVERDKRMAAVLQQNIDELGETAKTTVLLGDAMNPVTIARLPERIDLAFMDPPYPLTMDMRTWSKIHAQAERLVERLAPDGYLILRTPWPLRLESASLELSGADGPETHVYRQTAAHLYAPASSEPASIEATSTESAPIDPTPADTGDEVAK